METNKITIEYGDTKQEITKDCIKISVSKENDMETNKNRQYRGE